METTPILRDALSALNRVRVNAGRIGEGLLATLGDIIRLRLDLPFEKYTHFLRMPLPLPYGGSCL
jgi:hypothetical protein